MNPIAKEIKKIEDEIIETWQDCKEWEIYNKRVNDITRLEILESIKYIKRLEAVEKKYNKTINKRKVTYKEIAKEIKKSEAGVKYIAKTNPRMLELIKLGMERD